MQSPFRALSLPGIAAIITIVGVILYFVSRYINKNQLGKNLRESVFSLFAKMPYIVVLLLMAIPQQIVLNQVALSWEPPFLERIFISAAMVVIGMTWEPAPNGAFESDLIRILGTALFARKAVQMRDATIPYLVATDAITTLFVRSFSA